MGNLIGFVFSRLFQFLGISSKISRIFFGSIFLSLLFVLLYNVVFTILNDLFFWAVNQAQATDISGINGIPTANITGAAGWVLAHLRVPECVSLILSSYTIRIFLKSIPFIRVN